MLQYFLRWFMFGTKILSWARPEVFPWRWQLGNLLTNVSLSYFSEFLWPTLHFWAPNFIFYRSPGIWLACTYVNHILNIKGQNNLSK